MTSRSTLVTCLADYVWCHQCNVCWVEDAQVPRCENDSHVHTGGRTVDEALTAQVATDGFGRVYYRASDEWIPDAPPPTDAAVTQFLQEIERRCTPKPVERSQMQAVTDLIQRGLERLGRGGQSRLAEQLGVSRSAVSDWARGLSIPTMDRWNDIDRILGHEPGTLRAAAGSDAPSLLDRLEHLEVICARLESKLAELSAAMGSGTL